MSPQLHHFPDIFAGQHFERCGIDGFAKRKGGMWCKRELGGGYGSKPVHAGALKLNPDNTVFDFCVRGSVDKVCHSVRLSFSPDIAGSRGGSKGIFSYSGLTLNLVSAAGAKRMNAAPGSSVGFVPNWVNGVSRALGFLPLSVRLQNQFNFKCYSEMKQRLLKMLSRSLIHNRSRLRVSLQLRVWKQI